MAARQNYPWGNGGKRSKGLWLERNLGRSTSNAARPEGRRDPEVKCYLVQKQRVMHKMGKEEEYGRRMMKINSPETFLEKRVTQKPLCKCCLQERLWLLCQKGEKDRALTWYLLSYLALRARRFRGRNSQVFLFWLTISTLKKVTIIKKVLNISVCLLLLVC